MSVPLRWFRPRSAARIAAAVCALCAPAMPQHDTTLGAGDPGPTRRASAASFTVRTVAVGRTADGVPVTEPRVDADIDDVYVPQALRELARAMDWRLQFSTPELEEALRQQIVAIHLVGEHPERLARLVALAGGADAALIPPLERGDGRPVLQVRPAPSPATDGGRRALRRWAIEWYGSYLSHPDRDPEYADDRRIERGEMLEKNGRLDKAAEDYLEVVESDQGIGNPFFASAALRLGQCYLGLAQQVRVHEEMDPATERARLEEKNRYLDRAEEVLEVVGELDEGIEHVAAAAVVLGRVKLERGQYPLPTGEPLATRRRQLYGQAVARLERDMVRFGHQAELVDLHLLLAEAYMRLGQPGGVERGTNQVRGLRGQGFPLVGRQLSELEYLTGWWRAARAEEAQTSGDPSARIHRSRARQALEQFLAMEPDHERAPKALVLLGESMLALERYVDARSAAEAARNHRRTADLEPEWKSRLAKLRAMARIATGDRDAALDELFERVMYTSTGRTEADLMLYLIGEFMKDEGIHLTRAIQVARELTTKTDVDDPDKVDRARLLYVQALWKNTGGGEFGAREFFGEAARVLESIESPVYLRQATQVVGDAWAELGDHERAADAYVGNIRRVGR